MSAFFKTWNEIADYIIDTKGFRYLDNPTEWIEAFKEQAGNSRYVGNDTFYNPDGFYAIENWLSEGKLVTGSGEGGIKSMPTVENIITDTVTGGTTAGAAAAAMETAGITIELSVAGWLATGLVGMGLGVAAYEAAPEFWTNLSNAIFEPITGEHLTPEQTEPFLRKKLKTLLSTDSNGHIVTYVDRDMMERMYNFIQSHIQENGWDFFDVTSPYVSGQWSSYTPSYSYYGGPIDQIYHDTNAPVVDIPVKTNLSLTDDMIQSTVHQVQLMMESQGYTGAEPSASGIVNNLRGLYPNFNNANVHAVHYFDYYTSPTVQTRKVQITGYNVTASEDNEITARWKRDSEYTYYYWRYLRMGVNAAQAENNDYATMVNLIDANNQLVNWQTGALYSYEYDLDTGVGTVKDDGTSYIFSGAFWLGLMPGSTGQNNMFECYYTAVEPRGVFDNDLVAAGAVQKGKLPSTTGTMEQGYSEWFHKAKTIGTPTKTGANVVSNYIPANIPMTDTDTDKIIKKGVNINSDSYNDDQDSNQNGDKTPERNPVDEVNNDIDDNIKDFNDSDVDPFTAPEPAPQPLPDYPVDPPQEPGGESDDPPTPGTMEGVTASGMVSVYNPTKQQIIDFSAWLWSPNFFDNFIKLLQDPLDAIIGLHIMYATPHTSGNDTIKVGYLNSGVTSKVVDQQFTEMDCGSIDMPEYYGTALDYEPYVQVHAYLPFIGFVSLKPNDVIGKKVYLKYGIDALTGTCLAIITTKKDDKEMTLYNFAGNCAVQIPLTGGNYANVIRGITSMAVGVAGSVATGNPLGAIGGAISGVMSSHLDVSHSGTIGANAGAMGVRKPYVVITRKKAHDAAFYNQYYGYPANKTLKLGTCKGFTRVKSVHIDSIDIATDNEKTEIETLLKQGVIIK